MTERVESCEHEPIRIPGSIQPHGFLLAVDIATQTVSRVSANAGDYVEGGAPALLGRPWQNVLPELPASLRSILAEGPFPQEPTVHGAIPLRKGPCNVSSHSSCDELILEFEDRDANDETSLDVLYPQIRAAIEQLQGEASLQSLYGLIARLVRGLTGFDRTMVYRFDADWNGTVVGESRNERLPAYLDLRFPASDIPAQARELYRLNRVRLIPDAQYVPIPIESAADRREPLDLSCSVLRSVSPVHVEYMRNMQTPASMSVSIVQDGKLWGLISCHHSEPRRVPTQVRTACDFLAQIAAMQLSGLHRAADAAERVRLQGIQSELLAHMARERNFVDGLISANEQLLALTEANGAAIIMNGECHGVGVVPDEARIAEIVNWLDDSRHQEQVFCTDSLAARLPSAVPLAAVASGLLAVSISQIHRSYVLWFRPEVIQTVSWGGDPRKPIDPGSDRLHPRKSFETWKETVRLRSEPWSAPQVATAASLRNAVIGIVMRKAEQLADLSSELQRSNKELEAFSYSVSHDLRAPFRHIVGYAELLKEAEALQSEPRALRYVDTIIESARTAGTLVDGLLGFSQAGRSSLIRTRVDLDKLVLECMRMLEPDLVGRDITWNIEPLGAAYGDPGMLRQVFQNLLSNAIKYSRMRDPAEITIRSEQKGPDTVYSVSDNGVGFDMQYVGKLFGVFQRLHRMEEFEGTGIGLANVRRIAERHGGAVWAEGEVGKGATFYFSLPRREEVDL